MNSLHNTTGIETALFPDLIANSDLKEFSKIMFDLETEDLCPPDHIYWLVVGTFFIFPYVAKNHSN